MNLLDNFGTEAVRKLFTPGNLAHNSQQFGANLTGIAQRQVVDGRPVLLTETGHHIILDPTSGSLRFDGTHGDRFRLETDGSLIDEANQSIVPKTQHEATLKGFLQKAFPEWFGIKAPSSVSAVTSHSSLELPRPFTQPAISGNGEVVPNCGPTCITNANLLYNLSDPLTQNTPAGIANYAEHLFTSPELFENPRFQEEVLKPYVERRWPGQAITPQLIKHLRTDHGKTLFIHQGNSYLTSTGVKTLASALDLRPETAIFTGAGSTAGKSTLWTKLDEGKAIVVHDAGINHWILVAKRDGQLKLADPLSDHWQDIAPGWLNGRLTTEATILNNTTPSIQNWSHLGTNS